MAAVFISHSSRDNQLAAGIKAWLVDQGYENVFLDFDKETGLGAGREWERQLYEAIGRCHAVLLIVTPAWTESKWCFAELQQARALGKVIFPLVVTPDDRKLIVPTLRTIQAELWDQAGQDHLARRLREVAEEIARGHRWDPSRPPWPGIMAFEAEDAAVFFGRDPEIRKISELMEARRAHGGARLVLIVGASGSGKSSVLKAGVLPYLARDRGRFLPLPPFRPGRTPLLAFAKVLAEALRRMDDFQALRAELTADPQRTLMRALEALTVGPAREATVLISIDQFEELFTLSGGAERDAFLRLMITAADQERALPVLIAATVRSDLLGEILKEEGFAVAHEVFTLGTLPTQRLPSVIEGPAQIAAIHLEEGLVARILDDVGTAPEAVPLLAFTLRELNQRYGADKRLTLLQYEELGDRERNLSPLENAVRRTAEDVLTAVGASPEELSALREAFVGQLVRVNEEGVRLRRPARLEDIPESARPLVDRLITARLLSTRSEGEAKMVEVAHEALFKAWPQLAAWLDAEQDFLIGRRQIEDAERLWAGAPESQQEKALLSGLLLEKARAWNLAHPERLMSVRRFVLASIHKDEAEAAEAHRRQRMLTAAGAAVALIFAALSVVALVQRNEAMQAQERAEIAAREAKGRQLGAEAVTLGRDHAGAEAAERAAALAVEGWRRFPTPSAFAAADAALRNLPFARVEHDDQVQSIAFSPAGDLIATGSGNWGQSANASARLFRTADGSEVARIEHGNNRPVSSVAFSLNGKLLATISDTVRLFRTADRSEISRIEQSGMVAFSPKYDLVALVDARSARLISIGNRTDIARIEHNDLISSVSFNPAGDLLATGSEDGTVRLIHTADGSEFVRIHNSGPVLSVVFSPKGDLLATLSRDGTARVFRTDDGSEVARVVHLGSVRSLVFSPAGDLLATGGDDHTLRLIRTDDGSEVARIENDGAVRSLVFSPAGDLLAAGGDASTVRLIRTDDGSEIARFEHDGSLTSVAFSSAGDLVATASYDGAARLFRTDGGSEVARIEHGNWLASLAVSPAGDMFAIGSLDNTARLIRMEDASEVVSVEHGGAVWGLAFSPGGDLLATASGDGSARLIHTDDGSERARVEHRGAVLRVAFNSVGDVLATGGEDGTARLISTEDGSEITRFIHGGRVVSVAFSPAGHLLATGSTDGMSRLIRIGDGSEVARVEHGSAEARAVSDDWHIALAFSSKGDYFATASDDGTARLMRTNDGSEVVRVEHRGGVYSVAFSPAGELLATGSGDGMARLIRTDDGSEIFRIEHGGGVRSVAFSPAGDLLATGSEDGTARLIRTADGSEIARLEHGSGLVSVAFSPEGNLLATISDSDGGKARLFLLPDLVLEKLCKARAGRNLSPGEWERHIGSAEAWAPTCSEWKSDPDLLADWQARQR